MKVSKAISLCLSAVLSLTVITGCENGSSTSDNTATSEIVPVVLDTATMEVRQNDFRGGVMRTFYLRDNVLAIMDNMKRNNSTVREKNPNSYWTTTGYQDFVATFLTAPIINDVQWFNEEQTDWNTVCNQMMYYSANSFTMPNGEGGYSPRFSSMAIYRNEKDDYSIEGISGTIRTIYSTHNGNLSYRILYDCDKDWCKAYSTLPIDSADIPPVTVEMFEYARIKDNVFAIQTTTERLVVVLEEGEDMDIRERPIKEFYYSRLSGGIRTGFEAYEPLPEVDDEGNSLNSNIRKNERMAEFSLFNEQGDFAIYYGKNDSVFLQEDVSATNAGWVFEDGALQQAIIYKDGTLLVVTYNKLSEKYERFIYSIEKTKPEVVSAIEMLINIEGLVGVVSEKTEADTSESDGTVDAENVSEETQENTVATTAATSSSTTTTPVVVDNSEPVDEGGTE